MQNGSPLSEYVTAVSSLIDRESRLVARKVQSGTLTREEAHSRLLRPCDAMLLLVELQKLLPADKQRDLLARVADDGSVEAWERLSAAQDKLESIG